MRRELANIVYDLHMENKCVVDFGSTNCDRELELEFSQSLSIAAEPQRKVSQNYFYFAV
jgi:hypothetical protein